MISKYKKLVNEYLLRNRTFSACGNPLCTCMLRASMGTEYRILDFVVSRDASGIATEATSLHSQIEMEHPSDTSMTTYICKDAP